MALFVVAVALTGALVGPRDAVAASPAPASVDPRVLVLGDSVVLGAQGALDVRLAATGWQPVHVAAESLHVYEAGPIVDAVRPGFGDVAVVALGSNDGLDASELTVWVDDLMAHLRDVTRVYWVNLRQFREWVPAANAVLAAATQRWPNLRIIDWDARATPDPSLVYEDGLHLNFWGQIAMAELVGATLDEYAAERAQQHRSQQHEERVLIRRVASVARALGV
jgi:lysophospholipase L1-like esterase